MSKWACVECGGTNVWELSWVRTNRISWMLEYGEDVHAYTDTYPVPQTKCMDCDKKVFLVQKEFDND